MTMSKTLLNERIHIVEGNSKLTGDENSSFLIFNILSKVTCPYRTDICEHVCYAALEERYPSVIKSRQENLEESMKDNFVTDIIDHIEYQLGRKKYLDKHVYFRIHSAGDFYNQAYFNKWVEITNFFKDDDRITFEAYTKSLPYILTNYNPKNINITLVYSIMPDTKPENIDLAKQMGLKTFSACPIGSISENQFKCNGNCGPCTACYHKDNGIDDIYIEFHGARAKSVKRNS